MKPAIRFEDICACCILTRSAASRALPAAKFEPVTKREGAVAGADAAGRTAAFPLAAPGGLAPSSGAGAEESRVAESDSGLFGARTRLFASVIGAASACTAVTSEAEEFEPTAGFAGVFFSRAP